MKYFRYFSKNEWGLVLLVGGGYFINLYLLRGQNILAPQLTEKIEGTLFSPEGLYFLSSVVGLIFGTLFYGFYANKLPLKRILIFSAWGHFATCILSCTVIAYVLDDDSKNGILICIWRIVTGAMIAGEFGIGFTFLVEQLGRSKRLIGTAISTALGMCGVCFFSLINGLSAYGQSETPNDTDLLHNITWVMGIGAVLSLALSLLRHIYLPFFPKQEIDRIEKIKSAKLPTFRQIATNQNLLILAIIAMPVQFCINVLIPQLDNVYQDPNDVKIDLNKAYFAYYALFAFSVGLTAFFYHKIRSSKKIIIVGLILKVISIGIFISFVTPNCYIPLCILLGMSSGIWWLLMLIAVENSSVTQRAVAGVFVSNLARSIIFFMVFLNMHTNPPFSINIPALILVTISITGCAFVATSFLPKVFSPKLKESDDDNDLLSPNNIKGIREAQINFYNTKNIKGYLNECTEAIKNTVFSSFEVLRFAFFCLDKDGTRLIIRGNYTFDTDFFPRQNGDFSRVLTPSIDDPELIATDDTTTIGSTDDIRKTIRKLLEIDECFSFTNEILNRKDVNIMGILLYQEASISSILETLPDEYMAFDLRCITLYEKEQHDFWEKIELKDNNKIIKCLDSKLDRCPDIQIRSMLKREIKADELKKIKRTLLLHKLDAMRHRYGYYTYYVASYFAEQIGIAFLMTNYPARKEQLKRLADVVALVMSAVYVVEEKDIALEKLITQNNHGRNTLFTAIRTNLNQLENVTKNIEETKQYFKLIQLNFDSISKASLLSDLLAKINYKKANIQTESTDVQNIGDFLKTFEFSLSDAINECLKIIQDALETVVPKKNAEERKSYSLYLKEKLMTSVQKDLGNVKINGVKDAFQIILQDLLTNAVRYNAQDPEILIELKKTEDSDLPNEFCKKYQKFLAMDYVTLAVSNKFKLSEANYLALLGIEMENNTVSTTRSFGIDTIRRLLKYDGLGKTGKYWYFSPKNKLDFNEPTTTLFLLIPKDDIIDVRS